MTYPRGKTGIGLLVGILILLLSLSPVSGNGGSTAVPADQITILYTAGSPGSFEMLDLLGIDKILPPSDDLPIGEVCGFWYELRNADDEVVYRRVVDNPLRLVFEGPRPGADGASIPDREESIPAERVFSVILPRAEVGDELVFFSSPLIAGAQGQPAIEIGRIPLVPTGVTAALDDRSILGATKIVDNGPDSDRLTLVILSEGYQEGELTNFMADAQQFVDALLSTAPFDTHCRAFNVWRIDVASADSGADDPASCGGSGTVVDTYFDASFCGDEISRRQLGFNEAQAIAVLNDEIPEWDQGLLLVNSSLDGNAGGNPSATTLAGPWETNLIHALGHSIFGLADEYETFAGCDSGETGHDVHPMAEPVAANVTIQTDRALVKWYDLILPGTPVPTTVNADCSQCDTQDNPFPDEVTVGLFEGAHYYHCAAFRPVFDCMMRNYSAFCPVCTRKILSDLADKLPPNLPPVCDANGPYVAECEGPLTTVTLDATGSTDVDCDPLTFIWTGGFEGGIATGETVDVQFAGVGVYPVTLTVDDGFQTSDCQTEVTVEDTIPPDLAVIVEPNVLWPPNHKYVDIEATVEVIDICDDDVQVRLVSITSSEPDNDRGDGNTTHDINADVGADDRAFQLRAERRGGGPGRVYSILYEATDASGNASEVQAFVVVPKSQGRNGFPCTPGGPVTILPTVADEEDSLRYRWEAESCATWYQVWINRNGEYWKNHWYRKGHAVGRLAETIEDHPPGDYEWWIRAWSPGGTGPWAAGPSFTLTPPPDAGGMSFSGDDVILRWEEDFPGEADWYRFWINREGRPFWNGWVPASEVVIDGNDGSYELPVTLPLGRYTWWQQTWSQHKRTGPWSDGEHFDVGKVTVLEPAGEVNGADVTVVWDDTFSAQASWYQLWIGKDGSTFWSKWVPREDTGTEGINRSYPVPTAFTTGAYQVYVRAWQKKALGPWSEGVDFTVP